MKHWLAALVLAAAIAGCATQAPVADPSVPEAQALRIGTAHRIHSAALAERRTVNVVLPASYARAPEQRYPVLYLIDGGVGQDLLHVAGVLQLGALWGRSAEAIVVGIETTDRRRELAGPTADPELRERYPTAGASAAFRDFVRDDVQPLVERSYRSNGYAAVIGESLAGLFIVETYASEPALFDAYAAIDPSLWWDGEALSRASAPTLGARTNAPPIYLAVASEQAQAPAAMQRIAQAIHASGARLCLASRPDLLHSTIYQQLLPQALQFLLPPREQPPAEYGFRVHCDALAAPPVSP